MLLRDEIARLERAGGLVPTGISSWSSATAIHPFVPPPRLMACTISPLARSIATSVPSRSTVSTRSFTTVAAPSGSPGTSVSHSTPPVAASIATTCPSPTPIGAPK